MVVKTSVTANTPVQENIQIEEGILDKDEDMDMVIRIDEAAEDMSTETLSVFSNRISNK